MKKEKEFNLSEKIFHIDSANRRGGVRNIKEAEKRNQNPSKYLKGSYLNKGRIYVKDVKEFIKINKESEVIDEFGVGWIKTKEFLKRAGKMLIELTGGKSEK